MLAVPLKIFTFFLLFHMLGLHLRFCRGNDKALVVVDLIFVGKDVPIVFSSLTIMVAINSFESILYQIK